MSAEPMQLRRIGDDALLCRRLVLGESFWRRFMGLMGRGSMDEDEGLWLPTSSIHMLFMRFAIDALFVGRADSQGHRTVVGVREELPPWCGLVLPVRGAEGVIELPAGTLARHGVSVGDGVALERVGAPIG
jgi:uncharacterized protein